MSNLRVGMKALYHPVCPNDRAHRINHENEGKVVTILIVNNLGVGTSEVYYDVMTEGGWIFRGIFPTELEELPRIHRTKYGTFHPDPTQEVQWTIIDNSGYLDTGSPCDDCGGCDCDDTGQDSHILKDGEECIGLSYYYTCMDGGTVLCGRCFEKTYHNTCIVDCDCK